jgi:hypothetical protein
MNNLRYLARHLGGVLLEILDAIAAGTYYLEDEPEDTRASYLDGVLDHHVNPSYWE